MAALGDGAPAAAPFESVVQSGHVVAGYAGPMEERDLGVMGAGSRVFRHRVCGAVPTVRRRSRLVAPNAAYSGAARSVVAQEPAPNAFHAGLLLRTGHQRRGAGGAPR